MGEIAFRELSFMLVINITKIKFIAQNLE